ncbi:S1 family peptidase [Marinicellulosiphila megalodicopiae]|uniref:S1 family peptidase n=1 Tax=Marinicellulosiphila megalodicopiae TaxID=2724896 RepID=UPI003BB0F399
MSNCRYLFALILLIQSLVLSAAQTEQLQIQPKIIGGQPVFSNGSPYGFFARLNVGCGGAHIGNGVVLTAAHCVEYLHEKLTIDFPHDPQFQSETFEIRYIKMHPEYISVEMGFDLALIKIDAINGQYPESVDLLTAQQFASFTATQSLEVIGYGVTETQSEGSTHMQRVDIFKVSNAQCKANYKNIGVDFIEELMMCASDIGKDSCQGDSGGPLLYSDGQAFYHTGIVSFGNGCAEASYPGIYTRTDVFYDWILEFKNTIVVLDVLDTNYLLHPGNNANNQVDFEFINIDVNPITLSEFSIDSDLDIEGCGQLNNQEVKSNDSVTCSLTINGLNSLEEYDLEVEFSFLSENQIINQNETVNLDVLKDTTINDPKSFLSDFSFYSWAQTPSDNWVFDTFNGEFKSSANNGYETSVVSVSGYFDYGINFDLTMESEFVYDLFYVTVDGQIQFHTISSGVCAKQSVSVGMTPGNHRVAFIYSKDENTNFGLDQVKLSNIQTLKQSYNLDEYTSCFEGEEAPQRARIGNVNISFLVLMSLSLLLIRRKFHLLSH